MDYKLRYLELATAANEAIVILRKQLNRYETPYIDHVNPALANLPDLIVCDPDRGDSSDSDDLDDDF